jgi:hypothetical protein
VPLPAKGPTGKTQAKAIIGVSLKMYFGHERTLDWCRDIAGIAADHTGEVGGKIIAEVGGRFAHDPEALRTILDETAERLRLLTGTETTA